MLLITVECCWDGSFTDLLKFVIKIYSLLWTSASAGGEVRMNCLFVALIGTDTDPNKYPDRNFSIDFISLSTLVLITFVSTSFEQTCTILTWVKCHQTQVVWCFTDYYELIKTLLCDFSVGACDGGKVSFASATGSGFSWHQGSGWKTTDISKHLSHCQAV